MYPPIYAVCAADSTVTGLLTDSGGRLRLFPFGEAPQQCPRPYAVWSIVYGAPWNSLSCPPNVDHYGIQIDVYAETADATRTVAAAIRDALEAVQALVVRFNGESREAVAGALTRAYRYSFDVDMSTYRA